MLEKHETLTEAFAKMDPENAGEVTDLVAAFAAAEIDTEAVGEEEVRQIGKALDALELGKFPKAYFLGIDTVFSACNLFSLAEFQKEVVPLTGATWSAVFPSPTKPAISREEFDAFIDSLPALTKAHAEGAWRLLSASDTVSREAWEAWADLYNTGAADWLVKVEYFRNFIAEACKAMSNCYHDILGDCPRWIYQNL